MILDGKKVASIRNEQLKKKISEDYINNINPPSIAIINVGDNQASITYTKAKKKAAVDVGINAELINYPKDITFFELKENILKYNNRKDIDGIIIQLPLPDHLDEKYFINLISPNKDIDGFTYINQGKLFQNLKAPRAATPQGIINLLSHYKIDVSGLNVVVVGASQIVGLPLSKMLLDLNATVTVCHIKTKDLKEHTKKADLIISAVGKINLITKDMVKKDSIIIDVGMNRVGNKLYGDVDYPNISTISKYITPVPNGVGPMTINALLENAYELSVKNKTKS